MPVGRAKCLNCSAVCRDTYCTVTEHCMITSLHKELQQEVPGGLENADTLLNSFTSTSI